MHYAQIFLNSFGYFVILSIVKPYLWEYNDIVLRKFPQFTFLRFPLYIITPFEKGNRTVAFFYA